MHTRRQFIVTMASLAAAAGLPRGARAAFSETSQDYPLHAVPGGGFVFLGEGGAVLGLPTKEAPLIVDAKYAHTADDLARQVTRRMRGMPEVLINTHHHADHTGGNWAFSPIAQVIAHRNVKARLEANLPIHRQRAQDHLKAMRERDLPAESIRMAEDAAANIAKLTVDAFVARREFDADLEFTHGGVKVQLHHFGPGHTDNDAVVHFPELNMLHAGDLVFNRWHPYIDRPAGATTTGWQNSLRQTLALCDDDTVVIPGHGKVDTKAAIMRQIEYFDTVRGLVGKAVSQGKSRDEIGSMDDESFKDFENISLQRMALQAVHDELAVAGASGPT